ncbi:ORF_29 [Adoxophyes orana granulovirus]|uniref:ADOR29 n=1 Tax=Adoxophyes orana granulovirus TaxID=170617 RepID=Q7T9Y6_GVAO|nr:ORF_29 [Adoxophyes orana granulovirus]AAP85666.1 ORF_29 [Adoxophyes orana granulovirus]AJA91669.1 ADOR29 [Adoxophyes orana granulovirus]
MNEDVLLMLKNFNNKYNRVDDAYHELRQQYDKTQYELKKIKQILLNICETVAPQYRTEIDDMLNTHDKRYKTLYENNTLPLANIRFEHHLKPDLNTSYVWNYLL